MEQLVLDTKKESLHKLLSRRWQLETDPHTIVNFSVCNNHLTALEYWCEGLISHEQIESLIKFCHFSFWCNATNKAKGLISSQFCTVSSIFQLWYIVFIFSIIIIICVGPLDYGERKATIWASHIYAFVKYHSFFRQNKK
jgi:hypothetical protein